jgi:hypothetical protein
MQETRNVDRAPQATLRLVATAPHNADLRIRPPMAQPHLSVETVNLTGGASRRPDEVVMGHRLPDGSVVLHRLGEPCTECDVL